MNTPITDLLKQYEQEDSDFADMGKVCANALRYVQTMPNSHARCLLFVLAEHVKNLTPNAELKKPRSNRVASNDGLGGALDMSIGQLRITQYPLIFDNEAVESYRKLISSGQQLTPLLIVPMESGFAIWDGHHRYFAALLEGLDSVLVQIHAATESSNAEVSGRPSRRSA